MCLNPIWLDNGRRAVPCGRCGECLESKRKATTKRLLCESRSHECATFITLTYNDAYLPFVLGRPEYIPEFAAIAQPAVPSLSMSDIQRFFKRLRISAQRHFGKRNIRIFYCGEYGTQFSRPHYHAILFGLDLFKHPDTYIATTKRQDGRVYPIYSNRWLEKVWPFGFVTVDQANGKSMAYVAKYCTKKYLQPPESYNGKLPEFVRGSKNLGVAHVVKYHEPIFRQGKLALDYGMGVVETALPRYYLDKKSSSEVNFLLSCLGFACNGPWLLRSNFIPEFSEDSRGLEIKLERKAAALKRNLAILNGEVALPSAATRKEFYKLKHSDECKKGTLK